jgi:predicted hotdog family 3-hydroxylacyl-ACP dehydratase
MFSDEYGLPSWSSIELMAQTVSVFAGAKGQKLGLTPRIGYLLGTRKLNLPMAYFEHGKILKIRAEQQYLHEGLGQFACEISYEDHIIQAVLSVYEPPVKAEQS